MLIWVLVCVLLLICFLYIEFTPRDADPHFIKNQASISATKFPGESPTFRSLVNDHNGALLGTTKVMRNFKFIKMWDDVKKFKISVVTHLPQPQKVTNFEQLVLEKQKNLGNDVEIEDCSLDSLVVYFASMLNGVTPKLHKYVVEDKAEPRAQSTTLNPIIQSAIDATVKRNAKAPASESYEKSHSNPAASAMQIGSTSIDEVDLGVAVAAQLTAVGSQYQWNSKDTVLIAPGPLTAASLVAMLTSLSANATLVFADMGLVMNATQLLQKAQPTILISDDIAMRTLAKQRDLFRVPQWVPYFYRKLRLSKGALTKPAMLPGFKQVRLIYSISGPDPQQWLDNSEVADLRVLTGTQLVHVLAPDDGLPISQTMVGDYRFSSKLPGTNWGPPVPGLELKLRGGALYSQRANHTEFKIVKTVDGAKLMNDGCLYIPVQRPVVSEEYFYTGHM